MSGARRIQKVAVLGSGVMGSGIAAHLANAGIDSYLFDISPRELTAAEEAKGLTLESKPVRNRIVNSSLKAMLKAKPAVIFHKRLAGHITACNYHDDLDKLAEADWIVEVVVENIKIKKIVFDTVEKNRKPGSIVSSNTSGIPLAAMVEGRSEDFRKNFLITHFFNPVRYMQLLELVTGPETDPAAASLIAEFGEQVLGKGIVWCHDTPNFVANRIGMFGMASVMHHMNRLGLSIEAVDSIFGPPMGRPKTGVFRLADLVGVDTMVHVTSNSAELLTNDERRDMYVVPTFMKGMVEKGLLGNKTKKGFYKVSKGPEGRVIEVLDLETLEYRPKAKARFPSIGAAKKASGLKNKLDAILFGEDKASELAWAVTADSLIYSANRIGEVADDVANIDNGMKWGYAWKLGPFETWDLIGLTRATDRMRADGHPIPACVETLIEKGEGSWYVRKEGILHFWDVASESYKPAPTAKGAIDIKTLRASRDVVYSNDGFTLHDLGDGIALAEFHSKANSIDADIIGGLRHSLDLLDSRFDGMVVANEGSHFSVGANLMLVLMAAMNGAFDQIEDMVTGLQGVLQTMSTFHKPIVTAPHGRALGGGCEVAMQGTHVRPHGEIYMGLVEFGVGVIPAGGGCKELVRRSVGTIPTGVKADPLPFLQKAFETIGLAKVSMSCEEARDLGFIGPDTVITLNPDLRIAEAKRMARGLADAGFLPRQAQSFRLPGTAGIAAFKTALYDMSLGGHITEYERHMGGKLATILCGGNVGNGALVSEQDLLDLEREAFLSLCGEEKTRERMQAMLMTGKPLRN